MENKKTGQLLKIFSLYNHKDLTSIERLNYLLLLLRGQALQSVQGLPFTTNVRQMLALKLMSKEDVEEIKKFLRAFGSNLNALKALTLSQLMFHICSVSKTFGEWYQKTNKTEDTNKLTLLAFKIIAVLHNTRLATIIKLLGTVSKGLFRNRSQNSCS
jgi:hypothetical protein